MNIETGQLATNGGTEEEYMLEWVKILSELSDAELEEFITYVYSLKKKQNLAPPVDLPVKVD